LSSACDFAFALRLPDEPGLVLAGAQADLFGRLGTLRWFRDLIGGGDLAGAAVQRRGCAPAGRCGIGCARNSRCVDGSPGWVKVRPI